MYVPEGTIVAMITPFNKEGRVKEIEVRKLVNFLKERLKLEMNSLLYEYFPGISLNFKTGQEIESKYSYPEVSVQTGVKKHDECTQCGMCDGTPVADSETSDEAKSDNRELSMESEELTRIITDIVKKHIRE